MKSRMTYYPLIRAEFESISELGEVINRSRSYCKQRLNGSLPFTHKDKVLIARYLGVDVSEVVA